ncbi:MAG: copper chaperone PCu(A)C [Algiphilus sp.]
MSRTDIHSEPAVEPDAMKPFPRLLLAAAPMVVCAFLAACSGSSGSVTIADAWIERPGEAGHAHAHLVLHNDTDEAVRLVGAHVEHSAETVILHESGPDAAVIAVEAGGTLRVPGGGYRIVVRAPELAWDTTGALALDLAIERRDEQLLTVSREVHVHDAGDGHPTEGDAHHDH